MPRAFAIGLQHVVAALPPIAIYGVLPSPSLAIASLAASRLRVARLAAIGCYAALVVVALVRASPGVGVALTLAAGRGDLGAGPLELLARAWCRAAVRPLASRC